MAVVTYNKVKAALKGRQVLITGTTGFIGKVYLEKLLRTCPELGGALVIVRRNARYATARERFEAEVLTSSLFDDLRQQHPEALQKIRVIDGELTETNLGLSADAFAALGQEIDLIVNCAASVNFREELDKALEINTESLFSLARLAREQDIPFLQVSTCYVHGYHSGLIPEAILQPTGGLIRPEPDGTYDIESLIAQLRQRIDQTLAECATPEERGPRLIDLGITTANRHGWNDTYTMTKWMAEAYLQKALAGRTLTIVRPAIVESCLEDPRPGWIEGVKVADAVILAYARQKTTFLPGNPHSIIDIVPVDIVVNAMVLASAEAVLKHGGLRIYQVGTSADNPITIDAFRRIVQERCMTHWQTYDRLLFKQPTRGFRLIGRRQFRWILSAIGLYLDLAKRLVRNDSTEQAWNRFQTTASLATVFGFYMASTYRFDTTQLKRLAAGFGEAARDYSVDVRRIDWPVYVGENHLAGLNRYALKPRSGTTGQESIDGRSRRVA